MGERKQEVNYDEFQALVVVVVVESTNLMMSALFEFEFPARVNRVLL